MCRVTEMARKIYRHRQQQIVDVFDNLFTDVVDKALCELAKEARHWERPRPPVHWSLSQFAVTTLGDPQIPSDTSIFRQSLQLLQLQGEHEMIIRWDWGRFAMMP